MLSRAIPVLPFPGVAVMGLTMTTVPTFVKEESMIETEPTIGNGELA